MLNIVLLSTIAGLVGTGLGGLLGLFFCNKGEKAISCVLGFSGGIMLSVVLIELLPEAINIISFSPKFPFVVIFGVALGAVVIWLLEFCINSFKSNKPSLSNHLQKNGMLKSGILMFLAIALHNFPEGLALGGSGAISVSKAVSMAVLFALHDIPEGMAISLPLSKGGMKPAMSVLFAAIGGGVTILGAIAGFALGNISPFLISVCLSMAGGAMLYVTFAEIFPQAISVKEKKIPFLFAFLGVFVAFVACQ